MHAGSGRAGSQYQVIVIPSNSDWLGQNNAACDIHWVAGHAAALSLKHSHKTRIRAQAVGSLKVAVQPNLQVRCRQYDNPPVTRTTIDIIRLKKGDRLILQPADAQNAAGQGQ